MERRKRIYRKRIPYGMQNFEDIIKEDCYYVDKTPFIEYIEESNKYCKSSTTDEQAKLLFREASEQITRYADSDMVRELVKTTHLHKLVVIYRGAEMIACEEI